MRKILLVAACLLIGMTGTAAADTYVIDAAHSDVTFTIRHLISKVTGRFNEFSGNFKIDLQDLDASSAEFTIKAASIDTRNEDRDKHLRSGDFFEVETYPEITFKSSKISKTGDNTYDVTGTFTMHGVSKEITLPVTYLGEVVDPWGNLKVGFATSTTVDRKEYGIVWNKALDAGGMILGDEVEVEINLEVSKQ
jgi:polyisoprenoid-binding protein YceI